MRARLAAAPFPTIEKNQFFGVAKISCSEILKMEMQIASLVMVCETNCLPHYSHTQIATCIICYTIGLLTIGRQED